MYKHSIYTFITLGKLYFRTYLHRSLFKQIAFKFVDCIQTCSTVLMIDLSNSWLPLNMCLVSADQYGPDYGKPVPGSDSERRSLEVEICIVFMNKFNIFHNTNLFKELFRKKITLTIDKQFELFKKINKYNVFSNKMRKTNMNNVKLLQIVSILLLTNSFYNKIWKMFFIEHTIFWTNFWKPIRFTEQTIFFNKPLEQV